MVLFGVVVGVIAGLATGFGINVLATRLARAKPLLGPLHCTRSAHEISPVQALPLLGYVSQRGRCSTCGKRLPISFPLTELLVAALFAGLFLIEGLGWPLIFHATYVAFLVVVLIIDLKHRDIYLSVIAAGCVVALAGSLLLPGVGIVSALVGAGLAGGFFLLAYVLARLIFPHVEEPLGTGDILLALMMGLMLGMPNIVGALLVGPLIGGAIALILLISRRGKLGDFMPYGVALCAAAILFLVYPGPFAQALNLPSLMYMLSNIFG